MYKIKNLGDNDDKLVNDVLKVDGNMAKVLLAPVRAGIA